MPLLRGCSKATERENFRKLYAENKRLPPGKRRSRAQITAIVLAQARRTGAGRQCTPRPNPNRAEGTHISSERAASIRRRIDAYEKARRAFDPRRFEKGGSYSSADVTAISKVAGVRQPTNAELAALETYEWYTKPPAQAFVYYSDDMRAVTGFMGNRLGDITQRGQRTHRLGGETMAVHVRGTNGVEYVGICNLSGGNYCRLRRRK